MARNPQWYCVNTAGVRALMPPPFQTPSETKTPIGEEGCLRKLGGEATLGTPPPSKEAWGAAGFEPSLIP